MKISLSKMLAIAIATLLLAACAVGRAPQVAKASTWHLVFSDEFNDPAGSQPSSAKWNILNNSFRANQQECWVNDTSHVYETGDHLILRATYNPVNPCDQFSSYSGSYESGAIYSATFGGTSHFTFKYGMIKSRIWVPTDSGKGSWPAFWGDGANWPSNGEIDYLEIMKFQGPLAATQHLHGPCLVNNTGGCTNSWQLGGTDGPAINWSAGYHVFGAIWSPGKIQFTIDGTIYRTLTSSQMQSNWIWPFDKATAFENLILYQAVGGAGGTPVAADFPQVMRIDWIRVYQH